MFALKLDRFPLRCSSHLHDLRETCIRLDAAGGYKHWRPAKRLASLGCDSFNLARRS